MSAGRRVQIELGLRIACSKETGRLAQILRIIRESGGSLHAHLISSAGSAVTAFFLCDRPAETALALEKVGMAVDTETVVTVQTENRTGALSHVVQTLEAEGVSIDHSHAWARSDDLYVALRTDDNPKAEDLLRKYLLLADTEDPSAADGGVAPRAPEDRTR